MGISDLEAVLFSAAKPISIDVIQDIFKLSKQDSLTLIDHLASDLESHKRGIHPQKTDEYSGQQVYTVRLLGNRLEIM